MSIQIIFVILQCKSLEVVRDTGLARYFMCNLMFNSFLVNATIEIEDCSLLTGYELFVDFHSHSLFYFTDCCLTNVEIKCLSDIADRIGLLYYVGVRDSRLCFVMFANSSVYTK